MTRRGGMRGGIKEWDDGAGWRGGMWVGIKEWDGGVG